MANNILYTGRNLTPVLQNDGGQAMGRLSDAIIKAEETKYNVFKENEKEFLKTSNIDPAFFISTANQQAQGKLLEDYNKKWSQRMKASGNNMSLEDKQQMLAEKNLIIAQQQKMQSDQDLWNQHRALVQQNPTKFDADEFAIADAEYRKTGEYKLTMPPIKARSFDMALEDNAVIGNEILGEPIPETRGGIKGFYEQSMSGDEKSARQRVKDVAMADPAWTKDLVRQFQTLPLDEKLPYLTDTNADGKVDERDKSDENAIIRWAQDTKWQKAVKTTKGTWKAIPGQTSTTKAGKGLDLGTVVGKKRDINPMYGNISRPNMYSFGGKDVLTDVPTKGAKLLDDAGSYDYDFKGNLAKATLKDYDADRKTLIVQVPSTEPTSGIATQQLVEIPQENIPNYQSIKVEVNGKQVSIGSLETAKPTTTQKKKFNPATGQFE